MSKLNETAEELFVRLSIDAGPKMLLSLQRLKEACDDIERARGSMSYTRVAEVATAKFGGPKKQSVQNSHLLKSYIAARNCEYDAKFKARSQRNDADGEKSPSMRYEIADLDMKTRVYVTHLEDQIRRLNFENQNISEALKQATRAAPLSLADLISAGPDSEGGLQMEIQKSVPDSIRKLVAALLGMDRDLGEIEQLVIRRMGDAGELICIDHGIERHVVVQRQWYEMANWLREHDAALKR